MIRGMREVFILSHAAAKEEQREDDRRGGRGSKEGERNGR